MKNKKKSWILSGDSIFFFKEKKKKEKKKMDQILLSLI